MRLSRFIKWWTTKSGAYVRGEDIGRSLCRDEGYIAASAWNAALAEVSALHRKGKLGEKTIDNLVVPLSKPCYSWLEFLARKARAAGGTK